MRFPSLLPLLLLVDIATTTPSRPSSSLAHHPTLAHRSPDEFARLHRPLLRFDGSAESFCYPDTATNENNNQCKPFNSSAPIYYNIAFCGDDDAFMKLAWHFWYGKQKGCDPFGVDQGHGDDWEHITINFVRDGDGEYVQDSVTWFQHSGWYTRQNVEASPDVFIGKIAHGSYDNWCDGHGFVWDYDYCAGGCGYWDDFRNDDEGIHWLPESVLQVSEVTDDQVSRVNDYKYFDDPEKNSCAGSDARCIGLDGPCGCWRGSHTFPAPVCDV